MFSLKQITIFANLLTMGNLSSIGNYLKMIAKYCDCLQSTDHLQKEDQETKTEKESCDEDYEEKNKNKVLSRINRNNLEELPKVKLIDINKKDNLRRGKKEKPLDQIPNIFAHNDQQEQISQIDDASKAKVSKNFDIVRLDDLSELGQQKYEYAKSKNFKGMQKRENTVDVLRYKKKNYIESEPSEMLSNQNAEFESKLNLKYFLNDDQKQDYLSKTGYH